MSNRTDIVVETDNAEGQVLLSASRVYDLTEDKTQDTINSEVKNTLTQLETNVGKILPVITGSTNNSGYTIAVGDYFVANNVLYKATASIPQNEAWGSSKQAVNIPAINDNNVTINSAERTDLGVASGATSITVSSGRFSIYKNRSGVLHILANVTFSLSGTDASFLRITVPGIEKFTCSSYAPIVYTSNASIKESFVYSGNNTNNIGFMKNGSSLTGNEFGTGSTTLIFDLATFGY